MTPHSGVVSSDRTTYLATHGLADQPKVGWQRSTVTAWLNDSDSPSLMRSMPSPRSFATTYEHPGDVRAPGLRRNWPVRRPGNCIHGDRSKRAYGVGWERFSSRAVEVCSRRGGAPSDDRQRAATSRAPSMPGRPVFHPSSTKAKPSTGFRPYDSRSSAPAAVLSDLSLSYSRLKAAGSNHYNVTVPTPCIGSFTADRSALRGEFVNNVPRTRA